MHVNKSKTSICIQDLVIPSRGRAHPDNILYAPYFTVYVFTFCPMYHTHTNTENSHTGHSKQINCRNTIQNSLSFCLPSSSLSCDPVKT